MGTAWTYDKDIYQEHIAVRTKAGLMDVSGLKMVHLVGPHAINVLEYCTTRDMTKIYPGRHFHSKACSVNQACSLVTWAKGRLACCLTSRLLLVALLCFGPIGSLCCLLNILRGRHTLCSVAVFSK